MYDPFCSVYYYTVTLRIENVMEIVMEVITRDFVTKR